MPFIGRRRELEEVSSLLRDPVCRLVTIAGPGGMGKTRLAIQVAAQVAGDFAGGVYFVDLQPLSSPDMLPAAISAALDIPPTLHQDPLAAILAELQDRPILLIFDNFEHLVREALPDFMRLLDGLPHAKFLVTSRVALHLQEEWLYALDGFTLPANAQSQAAAHGDAVEFFALCARRSRPMFDLAAELQHVAQICRLVEGMPLALELAATWVRVLSCHEIAHEIVRGREVLATRLRNVPARHQSIDAVLDQTWSALSEEERSVYMRLSVFPTDFTREAANTVAGASLTTIAALMDHSLLRLTAGNRYTAHSLLRQFARAQLERLAAAHAATRRAFIEYIGAFLEREFPAIMGQDQAGSVTRITEELDNIRAAWAEVLLGEDEAEIERYTLTLGMYFNMTSRYLEGCDVLRAAISRLQTLASRAAQSAVSQALIACMVDCAYFHIRLGELDKAKTLAQDARAAYDALGAPKLKTDGGDPNLALALIAQIHGDYVAGDEYAHAAYANSHRQQHPWNHSIACNLLAMNAFSNGKVEAALDYARRGLQSTEATGNRWFRSYLLSTLGRVAQFQNDHPRAEGYFRESFWIRRDFNDHEGMAVANHSLAELALKKGDLARAQELFEASHAAFGLVHDLGGTASADLGLARVALARGDLGVAQHHLQTGLQAAQKIGYTPTLLGLLLNTGRYLAALGRHRLAARLFSMAERHPGSRPPMRAGAQTELAQLPEDARRVLGAADDIANLHGVVEETLNLLKQPVGDLSAPQPAPQLRAPQQPLIEPLTPRELEVLQLIGRGRSNAQIAEELILSLGTVKFYTTQIYGKLGVTGRVPAINRARAIGLLEQQPASTD